MERGTFSHRHAVIKVEDSEEELILLNSIAKDQGQFSIYNSLLSEYGVMGFDYGYALARPKSLTIWEAQFGDFSNGAQIMIDQYLSSAEDKWKLQNGLVLLLPHGYEGQGAEHSSARMERYLQLCAKDNMYVVDVTTPANLFHVLRRQVKPHFRKPLVVFTPKSLLRHPKVVSSIDEFTTGAFQPVIREDAIPIKNTKTLVFCTGKFYYDLIDEREKQGRDDVAIIRLEQLFPLPKKEIDNILADYAHVSDVVWAQEELEIWALGVICYYTYQQPSSFVWLPDDSMAHQPLEARQDSRDDTNKYWTMFLIVLKIICVNCTKTTTEK